MRPKLNRARTFARALVSAGLPIELAAYVVADFMRKNDIPISEANLDYAFEV